MIGGIPEFLSNYATINRKTGTHRGEPLSTLSIFDDVGALAELGWFNTHILTSPLNRIRLTTVRAIRASHSKAGITMSEAPGLKKDLRMPSRM